MEIQGDLFDKKDDYNEPILHKIECIAEEVFPQSRNRKKFHQVMQQKIVNLADTFNLNGVSEYRVGNIRTDGRDGLIDVVWLTDLKPIAVFEIDSSRRPRSFKKLLAVETPRRFWVYYGLRDPTSFIHSYDPHNLIQVIQLQNVRFERKRKRKSR